MALIVYVKNTFLDVDESPEDGSSSKRCSSVPRSWKPTTCCSGSFSVTRSNSAAHSVVSTAASDGEFSDSALMLSDSDRMDSYMTSTTDVASGGMEDSYMTSTTDAASGTMEVFSPVVSCGSLDWSTSRLNPCAAEFRMSSPAEAFNMGVRNPTNLSTTRLNPEARAFEPCSPSLAAEVATVIDAAKLSLMSCEHIMRVKVTEEGASGTCVVAEICDLDSQAFLAHEILSMTQAALLQAAANSQSVYILGYATVPFAEFQEIDHVGFKATVGTVQTHQQTTACWDTFQKGFCPRRATCRWCHPSESELVPLSVIVKKFDVNVTA